MSTDGAVLPPGPTLPKLLQTAGFLFAPIRFMEAMRRRYGDVVFFRTHVDSGFVVVFEPALVKQVMQGSPDQLRAGEANALLEPVVGRRSVLLLDGAEHLRHRRLMLPPFHGKRLKTYEALIRRATDREIERWPISGEAFPLLASMQSLTLDVIMGAVFGVGEGGRREALKRRVRSTLDPVGSNRGLALFALATRREGNRLREFQAARKALDHMLHEEIALRREVPDLEEREDVLSMLLLARDEDDRPLTDAEVRDELITLLVAGHETTATALAWAFDLIFHSPAVHARLLRDDDPAYLDAVVKETLRLRPVIAGVGRVVRGEPFALGGHEIPPGVEINPSIAIMHRRADRYPDPHAFRPERFLGPDAPDTYTWFPFGGGTRRCLGANFALFEMRIVIEHVLRHARLRPVRRRPERMVRRGITQVPKNGVRVRVVRSG